MFVLTINQRDTAEATDRVDELIAATAHLPALRGFQRSWADEAIGVFEDPATAIDAALIAVRQRRWSIGIGAGPVHQPFPEDIRDAEGYGLIYAREAVERAQASNEKVPLAVIGLNEGLAAEAQAVIKLLGQLVYTRTDAEWRVLDLLTPGVRGQYKAVAAALGISVQAVSQSVRRAFWVQEWETRPAAARLLGWAGTGEHTFQY